MYPITKATLQDKEELLQLYRSLHNTPGCTWSDEYPNEVIITEDLLSGNLFCMKNSTNKIIAALSIEKDPEVSDLTNWTLPSDSTMEISRVAVHHDYQGKGLARLMILHAIDYLKTNGYQGAYFLVSQTNFKALSSYQQLGFSCCGHAHILHNDWYCYEKSLT